MSTLLDPLDKRPSFSLAEVAAELRLDKDTVRRDLISGQIPGGFQRKPGGHWRIRRDLFLEWYKKQGTH